MNIKDLLPAGKFAQQFGVKAICYGGPGVGKTPIFGTAPRPLLLATEPGLLSMKGSNVPTYRAFTEKEIDAFFLWFFESNEVKNFDTLGIDSTSQMADIYLQEAKKTIKHGLQQYGYMAERTMNHLRRLYFKENVHTYLIAKQQTETVNNIQIRKPYYPGQQLPIELPHMFDAILHLAKVSIPNVGETLAFRCQSSYDTVARDRTGKLNEYEPPNFADIIRKCMS